MCYNTLKYNVLNVYNVIKLDRKSTFTWLSQHYLSQCFHHRIDYIMVVAVKSENKTNKK